MKEIINGKRYDTETATKIAETDHYNNGNYSGTSYIGVTPKGNLFSWTESNGQDCYLSDSIGLEIDIDGMDIIDEELAVKYNLIEEA
jgi:hypothetical protein